MDVDGDNNSNLEVNSKKKTKNRGYSYSDPPVTAVEGAPSRRRSMTLITQQQPLEVSGRPRTTTVTTLSTDTDVSLLTPRSATSSSSLSSLSPSHLFYPRINNITSGRRRKETPWERSATASWCSHSNSNLNATSWTKTLSPAAHTIPSASSVDPFNLFGFFPTTPIVASVAGVIGCKEWDWLREEMDVDSGKTAEEESYHDDRYYTEAELEYEYRLDDGRMMEEEDENTIRSDIIREREIGHIEDVAEQVIDEEDKFGVLGLTGGKIALSVAKHIGSLVGKLLGFGGFVEGVAIRDYYSVAESREDMEGVCWRYRCERRAREEDQGRE